MRIAIASSSAAVLFAFASPAGRAATASGRAHVETKYEPNAIGPDNTSCNTHNDARECNRLLDQPMLVTDQNGVSTASLLRREVFVPTSTGGVPNFLLTGNAHALALPGSLHGSVTVEVSGTGGADTKVSLPELTQAFGAEQSLCGRLLPGFSQVAPQRLVASTKPAIAGTGRRRSFGADESGCYQERPKG